MPTTIARELATLRERALAGVGASAASEAYYAALAATGDPLSRALGGRFQGPEKDEPDNDLPFGFEDDEDEGLQLPRDLVNRVVGRLWRYAEGYWIEDGFLRRVELAPMPARRFLRLIGMTEWEGVTSVGLPVLLPAQTPMASRLVQRFLAHQVCRHLRQIDAVDFATLGWLEASGRTFDRLSVVGVPEGELPGVAPRVAWEAVELRLQGPDDASTCLAWLMAGAAGLEGRLEVLRLSNSTVTVGGERFLAAAGPKLGHVETEGWTATREPGGWHVRAYLATGLQPAEHFIAQTCELLRAFGPIASRFTVHLQEPDPAGRRRLEASAQGRPLTVLEPVSLMSGLGQWLEVIRARRGERAGGE